jgi:hypothetical protein
MDPNKTNGSEKARVDICRFLPLPAKRGHFLVLYLWCGSLTFVQTISTVQKKSDYARVGTIFDLTLSSDRSSF